MREQGVGVAFGVISIHNIPLVEAVDRDLRFVPVRHEAAAVNAADGYARASGGIGVAVASTGTGAGNAAGAMLEALTAQSRVLHVTGNIDAEFLGEDRGVYHEVPRQLEMLTSVSGHAVRVENARRARRTLTEAVRLLHAPPYRPVSVDWPIDLQYTAEPGRQHAVRGRDPEPVAPPERLVHRALGVMVGARRPLIWAGGGARRVGPALAELAAAWGAPVLTGANGRGSIREDHPLCVGNFAVDEAVREVVAEADCLLTIGSHLRSNETANFQLPLPDTHVQIDLDRNALGRNYPATVAIRADATETVPALLAGLGEIATDDGWADRVRAAGASARKRHQRDIGAYRKIADRIRAALPDGAPIVRDVTIPGSSWGQRLLPIYDPTTNLYAAGGGIGQGLATAIGAGIARPDQIFNDGGYGVLRNMQRAKDSPARAVDLCTPDFALVARSLDLPHKRVRKAKTLATALDAALARTGPSIIEIDVPALRPRPAPFVPPVDVP